MSRTAALASLLEIVNAASALGSETFQNGTRLIGRVPHVAPEAWLHVLFAGLNDAQIARAQELARRPLPEEYAWFLNRWNGLSLFSGALSIYGLRESYARTGDAVWQPFSIEDANVHERPRDAAPTCVFVGGYRGDGSRLYMNPPGERVFRCSRATITALNEWPGFMDMLASEAARLATLFDDRGRRADRDVQTAPEPQIR